MRAEHKYYHFIYQVFLMNPCLVPLILGNALLYVNVI